ncbi:XG isoform 4 [Pan troglodytes]|uniref:XG isoform 4 n=1 Tax=Pan troglodytes TaxID=9598 RepID=A0A2J8ITL6_PANTR|nr:XG isoform 4 [Pan troglodytes]
MLEDSEQGMGLGGRWGRRRAGRGHGYFNDVDRDDGRYPPRPRPRPPAGGDHHSTYGNPEGNMVAKIVSPIVSVVVVTLLGAAASYFKLNNRRNCFRTHEPENV